MATSGEAFGTYSGRSGFKLRAAVSRADLDEAGNRTRWNYSLRVINSSGVDDVWTSDTGPYDMRVEGVEVADGTTPAGTYDFRDGAAYHSIRAGTTGWYDHDSDGNLTLNYAGTAGDVYVFGSASASGEVKVDRIPAAPGKPGTPTFTDITATGVTVKWSAAARGHADIDNYRVQFATDAKFTDAQTGYTGSGSTRTYVSTSRTPGTKYYVRVQAHNGDGWGDWSTTTTFKTLSGAYVSDGTTTWQATEVTVSDGAAWQAAEVYVSNGSTWEAAG